jgi:hypothetical protein
LQQLDLIEKCLAPYESRLTTIELFRHPCFFEVLQQPDFRIIEYGIPASVFELPAPQPVALPTQRSMPSESSASTTSLWEAPVSSDSAHSSLSSSLQSLHAQSTPIPSDSLASMHHHPASLTVLLCMLSESVLTIRD